MPQFLRPDADYQIFGSWSQVGGIANQLFTTINSATIQDATYIQTPNNPGADTFYRAGMSDVSTPAAGTVTVRYRISKDQDGGRSMQFICRLYEIVSGSLVQRAEFTHSGLSSVVTQFNSVLSTAQRDSITNWNNIVVGFDPTVSGGGAARAARLYRLEIETPDPAPVSPPATAPGSLVASPSATPGVINVSFNAVSGATAYEVWRSMDWSMFPMWVLVDSTASTTRTITTTPNRRVQIRVRAVNSSGQGPYALADTTSGYGVPSAFTPENSFRPTGHGDNYPFTINNVTYVLLADNARSNVLGVFRADTKAYVGGWEFQGPLKSVSVFKRPGANTHVIVVNTTLWTTAVRFDGTTFGPVENIEQLPVTSNPDYYTVTHAVSSTGAVNVMNGEDYLGIGSILTEQQAQASPGAKWRRSYGIRPDTIAAGMAYVSDTELLYIYQRGVDICRGVWNPVTEVWDSFDVVVIANAFPSLPTAPAEGWFRISPVRRGGSLYTFVYTPAPGSTPQLVYYNYGTGSVFVSSTGAQNVAFYNGTMAAAVHETDGVGMLYSTATGGVRVVASEDYSSVESAVTTTAPAGPVSASPSPTQHVLIGNEYCAVTADWFNPDEINWFVAASWFPVVPNAPTLLSPANNAEIPGTGDVNFSWTPDGLQTAFLIRRRRTGGVVS